jgi:hypothetical protein
MSARKFCGAGSNGESLKVVGVAVSCRIQERQGRYRTGASACRIGAYWMDDFTMRQVGRLLHFDNYQVQLPVLPKCTPGCFHKSSGSVIGC